DRPRRRRHPGPGGPGDQARPRRRGHSGRAAAPPVRRLRHVPRQRAAGAVPAGLDRRLPQRRRLSHAVVLLDVARQPHRPVEPRRRPDALRRPGRSRPRQAARPVPEGGAAGPRPVRGHADRAAGDEGGGGLPGEGLRRRPARGVRRGGGVALVVEVTGGRPGRPGVLVVAAVLGVAAVAGAAGCSHGASHRAASTSSTAAGGGSAGPGSGAGAGRPLRVGVPEEPASLDPFDPRSRTLAGEAILGEVLPQLFRVDPAGREVGWLADDASVRVAPDGRSATFALRPGARWSDGAPITVDDVRFTLDTVRGAAWPGPAAGYDRVTVDGAGGSVTLRFDGPFPGWRRLFSGADFVLPAHRLAGKDLRKEWTSGPDVFGGPFRLGAVTPGLSV